jgi:hypothetical protein
MTTLIGGPYFDRQTDELLHRGLDAFNKWRLCPMVPAERTDALDREERRQREIEIGYVEAERARVTGWAGEAPSSARSFVAWYEALERTGPGQHDPLFEWLEHSASLEQMRWFLRQEVAGEAGFDDLVALTQVKMPERAKLELARNYWDEMGQGHPTGMHGPMLSALVAELAIPIADARDVVWESLALGNLLVALASHRRYAFHAIGALGAIELTAPGRAVHVNAGLKRLGVDGEARRYFALHATLDVKHSAAWNEEVILPLVEGGPHVARAIAEGALLRLSAGERCFQRYKRELGLTAQAGS